MNRKQRVWLGLGCLVIFFLIMHWNKQPLINKNSEYIFISYQDSFVSSRESETYNLSKEEAVELFELLSNTKGYAVSPWVCDFFLSQNYIGQNAGHIRIMNEQVSFSIYSSGVLHIISGDKYIFFSWFNNKEKVKILYDDIKTLLQEQEFDSVYPVEEID